MKTTIATKATTPAWTVSITESSPSVGRDLGALQDAQVDWQGARAELAAQRDRVFLGEAVDDPAVGDHRIDRRTRNQPAVNEDAEQPAALKQPAGDLLHQPRALVIQFEQQGR